MGRVSVPVGEVVIEELEAHRRELTGYCYRMLGAGTDPITIVINSPGGSVIAGFDIVSQIRMLQRHGVEVRAHVQGDASSMAAVILAACQVRSMTSLSRLMWHGIQAGTRGDMTDMKEQQKEIARLAEKLAAILVGSAAEGSKFANASWVKRTMGEKRPVWITPEEALDAGLVGEVVD